MATGHATADAKRMEDSHAHLVFPEDNLRKVEVNVVIPKMMKVNAMKNCHEVVEAFTNCCKGRTVSIIWACNDVNKALDKCLRDNMTDKHFLVAKEEFIRKKAEHEKNFSPTPPTSEKMGGI